MSTITEMVLDLTETTKTVYDAAHKQALPGFDDKHGFVTARAGFSVLYLHIKSKYYMSAMLIAHTYMNVDAFKELCTSVNELEPRNIMRVITPKLWTVPVEDVDTAA